MKWQMHLNSAKMSISLQPSETHLSRSMLRLWILLFTLIIILITCITVTFYWSQSSSFTWTDCTGSGRGADIHEFRLSPNPLVIPGNVSIGFDITLNRNLVSPTRVSIRLQKKWLFVWTDIPCIDNFGSCSYEFCDLWPIPGPECPTDYIAHGIPCSCPFSKHNYFLPSTVLGHIRPDILPSWLESGEYWIQVNLWDEKISSRKSLSSSHLPSATDNNFLCFSSYLSVNKK